MDSGSNGNGIPCVCFALHHGSIWSSPEWNRNTAVGTATLGGHMDGKSQACSGQCDSQVRLKDDLEDMKDRAKWRGPSCIEVGKFV